jgi:hypothetical protein
MATADFTAVILVEQSPDEAFAAINNVSAWWTGAPGIAGSTDKLNDEFTYEYKPYHYSKQRITELVPGKKIEWLIMDSELSFVTDKSEWNGTKITFDITKKGDNTEVRFTHVGLVPGIECYSNCSNAWSSYIKESLFKLLGGVKKVTVSPD